MMHAVIAFWILLIMMTGCSFSPSKPFSSKELLGIPQDFRAYTKDYVFRGDINASLYETHYFEAWHYEKAPKTLDKVLWPYDVYAKGDIYGNTLQKRDKSYFEKLLQKANFKAYDTLKAYAISTVYAHMKNFPSNKPLFRNPDEAGEGFPFDYNQNSAVHANEPLYLSHYSKSGEWVYVFTAYASGWLRSREVAFIEPRHRILWEHSLKVHLLSDTSALKGEDGTFLEKGRIGMLLPLISQKEHYKLLFAKRGLNGKAIYTAVSLPLEFGSTQPLLFSADTLADMGNIMIGQEYGWGGLFEDRDCSSMLRDYFSLFGIWLPRNSFQQSKIGLIYDLKGLDRNEKIAMIRNHAIPFETLFYKAGHIMLYLGMYHGKITIFHDTWGVKTKQFGKEGRYIIGKSVISTLDLGSNLTDYDEDANLLEKIESFNVLTQER